MIVYGDYFATSHCLMGNLPLSASNISFPPTLNWSLLQAQRRSSALGQEKNMVYVKEKEEDVS